MTRAKRQTPLTPDYWQRACDELAGTDPVLAGLIERYGATALRSRADPFGTLARSVVGQQISVKAADAVWGRLAAFLGEVTPARLLAEDGAALRQCGLSVRKVEYLQDLAARFSDGRIQPSRWHGMDDLALIAELSATRGIGVWTAEMLLIFNLMRPDVFPLDDKGLQKAVAIHYRGGEMPSRQQLATAGESWRPWRSVATWYLWRSLDPVPVEY